MHCKNVGYSFHMLLVCCSSVNYFIWFCCSWLHESVCFDITCVGNAVVMQIHLYCLESQSFFLVVLLPLNGLVLYLLLVLFLSQVVMGYTASYFKWSWITFCYNDLICTVNLTSIFSKMFCSEVYKLLLVSCHLENNFTRRYFPFWLQIINSTGSITSHHPS